MQAKRLQPEKLSREFQCVSIKDKSLSETAMETRSNLMPCGDELETASGAFDVEVGKVTELQQAECLKWILSFFPSLSSLLSCRTTFINVSTTLIVTQIAQTSFL